jgi:hypothetical protein
MPWEPRAEPSIVNNQFALLNSLRLFINIPSSFLPTYPPLITFIEKIQVVNAASSSRCMVFNLHRDKEISSVQTAAPGQQLRNQSPESSHRLPRHCVHTPLFLPQDTLQTMQHEINAIHCTVCSKAAASNICLFCHGLWCSLSSMWRNVPIQPTQFIPLLRS